MNGKKTNLYLLTGFYGSGKTTALMRILDQVDGQRVGVIQTEHGELEQGIEITQDKQGSLCCLCSQGHLLEALGQLADRQLDDLFVESTGLSDLTKFESAILQPNTPLESGYELRGVICLIDANHFMEQKSLESVQHQLRHCHLAVINKADLVSPELLEAIRQQVLRFHPGCDLVSCSFGGFNLELLKRGLPLSCEPAPEQPLSPDDTPVPFVLNCRLPVPVAAFHLFLNSIKTNTYRIKGFFQLESGWFQVEGIGAQIDLTPAETKAFSHLRIISRIGESLGDEISQHWDKLIGLDAEIRL